MARKPLITPGSVLPPGGESHSDGGVLDRIIARDRERSGRAEAPEQEEEDSNVTTLQRAPESTQDATNESANDPTTERSYTRVPGPVAHSGREADAADAGDPPREAAPKAGAPTERMETALARAREDDVAVVTVRAPASLNSYIDRYVERINRINPRLKYRKQDAVAEMFAWFYAEHQMPPAPSEEDL